MKLYFLGCAGWIPFEEQTSCFMIEHKNKLLFLDAGTGIANLKKYTVVLDKYDTITIILSHYHLDHIIGLIYLLPFIKGKALHIYGPGKPVYEQTTREYLETLLQNAMFSRPLSRFCDNIECIDYGGSNFFVDDVYVQVNSQIHSAPSFRLTIDNKLIYATDTFFNSIDWSGDYRGMTLLHECWEIIASENSKHTALSSLLTGLPSELLKSTFLIHKNPEWSVYDYKIINEMIKNSGVKLAVDDMIINL